jgi:hypothetical protein
LKNASNFKDISDIIINSLKIFRSFKDEYTSFKKEKKCNFDRINQLERDLYDLKNDAHALIRDGVETKEEIQETDLFDLIVSSMFHEMLHLKEYIYIIERYEPRYLILEEKMEEGTLDVFKKDFLHHSREIVGEAKLGLPLKMQGINELVTDALPHLEQIIKMHSFDSHMIRAIYTYADIVSGLYEKGLVKLYDSVYEGGWIEGFFLVSESFIKGGFFNEAREVLDKIVKEFPKTETDKARIDYFERSKTALKNIEATFI